MCVIRWFLLKSCIFGMYILVTGASVLLQTLNGGTTYSKGSNVTLVCTITPYNNEMTWYVDNDPYGGCFLGKCAPSANKPYTFSFDFDETTGVFKLTIDPVDFSHAELSFVCDDGTVTKTISFTVTAVTNEGNEDNDDSELSEGEIVVIVLGCVFGTAFICTVVILPVYLRHRRDQRAAAAAAAAAQQVEQRRKDQRAAAAAAQQAEQRRKEKLTEIIEEWIAKPEYYRIIMQEFLKIDTLFETLVKETEKVFSKEHGQQPFRGRHTEQGQLFATVRYIEQEWKLRQQRLGQRRISPDLVGSTTDARSKMQELVNDSTFSSHIMQDKDFLRFIKRELQTNTALYEAIEEVIGEE